eukprot:5163271-Prymnesium_polylepis.1
MPPSVTVHDHAAASATPPTYHRPTNPPTHHRHATTTTTAGALALLRMIAPLDASQLDGAERPFATQPTQTRTSVRGPRLPPRLPRSRRRAEKPTLLVN